MDHRRRRPWLQTGQTCLAPLRLPPVFVSPCNISPGSGSENRSPRRVPHGITRDCFTFGRSSRSMERICMSRIYLVRHGRAAADWGSHEDPGLDEIGRAQAETMANELAPRGPLPLIASPL